MHLAIRLPNGLEFREKNTFETQLYLDRVIASTVNIPSTAPPAQSDRRRIPLDPQSHDSQPQSVFTSRVEGCT